MRFLFADPAIGWLDDLVNPIGMSASDYAQGIHVNASRALIVCLSRQSIEKRGFVQREIQTTLSIAEEMPQGSVFVIPARLEECVVPDNMQHLQRVDLFKNDGYERLLRSLKVVRQR